MCSPLKDLREARKIFEAVGAGNHIDDSSFLDGLAGVARFELGEFLIARSQKLRRAAQHSRPFGAGHARPKRLVRAAPRVPPH